MWKGELVIVGGTGLEGGREGFRNFNKIKVFFFFVGTYAVSWTLTHVE